MDYGYYNMDCMEGMRRFPDKYFDLAIVDPPYFRPGTQRVLWSESKSDRRTEALRTLRKLGSTRRRLLS